MPAKKAPSRVRNTELAKRVKVALAEDGRRDYEIAEVAGVTPSWLSSLKNGWNNDPDTEKLKALAKVLGKAATHFTEVIERYRGIMGRPAHPAEEIVTALRGGGTDVREAVRRLPDEAKDDLLRQFERLSRLAELETQYGQQAGKDQRTRR